MQNLTAGETNNTVIDGCVACLLTFNFRYAVLPYVFISLPANSWVLRLMISSPVFWTDRMEVSVFHMVLTELIFGFLGIPLICISFYFDTKATHIVTKLLSIMCKARVQFQSTVCIERYLAVVRPLLYLRFKPLRYRMSFCYIIWLQTILVGVSEIFLCQIMPFETNLVYFAYVFGVNSFCSISVLTALKQPSPGEGDREKSNLSKRRAFKLVFIFQVIAVLGYVPLITVLHLDFAMDSTTFCHWMGITYSFMIWIGGIYPLIYLYKAKKHIIRDKLCVHLFQM